MKLSELSIRRPVFARVISLLLVIRGFLSLTRLAVREYPEVDPVFVSITTNYLGAGAAIVENKITQVIEDRIAGLEGIETLRSSSRDGRSAINVEFSPDRDGDAAANDIRDRVAPGGSWPPCHRRPIRPRSRKPNLSARRSCTSTCPATECRCWN